MWIPRGFSLRFSKVNSLTDRKLLAVDCRKIPRPGREDKGSGGGVRCRSPGMVLAWQAVLQVYRAVLDRDGVVPGRVDVLTDTQAIELDWLKGNKFHEGIGQALHYGDVTGQQPVLALISAYYDIFGAEQQKLEYVSGLCAAHGVEVWALTTRRE